MSNNDKWWFMLLVLAIVLTFLMGVVWTLLDLAFFERFE